MVSPILAHLSLHHVLEVWCAAVVHPHCAGQAARCREADDVVCACQDTRDAERCSRVLGTRCEQYGVARAPENTRLRRCSRYQHDVKNRCDCLGWTFFWGTDRTGTDRLQRRTARSRRTHALRHVTAWSTQARNQRLPALMNALNSQLRGYSNSNFGFARGSRLPIDTYLAKVGIPLRTKEAAMTNPLRFDDLQAILHQRIDHLPDHRKPSPNTRYTIQDAVLGALGLFFTQSPSF